MSSIVAFTLGIIEYVRNRKTEGWIFGVIAGLFLVVSFDAVWQDEHRNSEILIQQKADLVSTNNQLNGLNRSQDTSIRELITSISTSNTAIANTQTAFASLSNRVPDISKPEPMRIITTGERLPYWDEPHPKEFLFIAFPNKVVAQLKALVECDQPIATARAYIVGSDVFMGHTSVENGKAFVYLTNPVWGPTSPAVVYLTTLSGRLPESCSIRQI